MKQPGIVLKSALTCRFWKCPWLPYLIKNWMRYLRLKWRHKFPNRLVNFDFGCKKIDEKDEDFQLCCWKNKHLKTLIVKSLLLRLKKARALAKLNCRHIQDYCGHARFNAPVMSNKVTLMPTSNTNLLKFTELFSLRLASYCQTNDSRWNPWCKLSLFLHFPL